MSKAAIRSSCLPGLFAGMVFALFMLGSPASAQPAGASGDDFVYRVMARDTLIGLSSRYTGTESNWPLLQSLNSVADPFALPIGKELHIPFSLIPVNPAQARIVHVLGSAQRNGSALRTGDVVSEADVLHTAGNSYITLELPDGSISTLPASSRIQVTRLRSFAGTGLIDVIFKLEQGTLESNVAPDGRGAGRYEIRGPVSITGVRGTRLRVHASNEATRSEVLDGVAQMQAQSGQSRRLLARQGSGVTAGGELLPVRTLLAAPRLHSAQTANQGHELSFDPVPGARAYLLRVAADELGSRITSSETIHASPAAYPVPGPGTWYVLLRAIDEDGLMGEDASLPFEGHAVLLTGFGEPVRAGQGGLVRLHIY